MLGTTVDKRVLGKLLLSAFAITPAIQMLVSIGQGNAELLELAESFGLSLINGLVPNRSKILEPFSSQNAAT